MELFVFPEAFFVFRFPFQLAPLPGASGRGGGAGAAGPGAGGVRGRCVIRAVSGKGRRKGRDGSGRDGGSSRATGRAGGGSCGAVRDGPGGAVAARAPLEPGRAGKRRAPRRKLSVVTEVVGEEKKGRERKGRRDGTRAPLCQGLSPEGAARCSAAPCGAGADPAAALGVWPCLLSAVPNLHVKCAASSAQDNGLPNAISGLLVFYLLVFRW